MPTPTERIRKLVACGLMPETAQAIVEGEVVLGAPEADAHITAADRARVQAFVLYSPLIPDRLREMFSAAAVA